MLGNTAAIVDCVWSYMFSRVTMSTRVVAWIDTFLSKLLLIYSSYLSKFTTVLTNDFRKHIITSLFAILYSIEQVNVRVSRCRCKDSISVFIFSIVLVQWLFVRWWLIIKRLQSLVANMFISFSFPYILADSDMKFSRIILFVLLFVFCLSAVHILWTGA